MPRIIRSSKPPSPGTASWWGENAEFTEASGGYRRGSNAPVLGLYGGQDTGIPLDTVETMRHALRRPMRRRNRGLSRCRHAFNADYRPSYHEESAKDGWQRMLAWFRLYGAKKG
jgi:dienelactone hydrolase